METRKTKKDRDHNDNWNSHGLIKNKLLVHAGAFAKGVVAIKSLSGPPTKSIVTDNELLLVSLTSNGKRKEKEKAGPKTKDESAADKKKEKKTNLKHLVFNNGSREEEDKALKAAKADLIEKASNKRKPDKKSNQTELKSINKQSIKKTRQLLSELKNFAQKNNPDSFF